MQYIQRYPNIRSNHKIQWQIQIHQPVTQVPWFRRPATATWTGSHPQPAHAAGRPQELGVPINNVYVVDTANHRVRGRSSRPASHQIREQSDGVEVVIEVWTVIVVMFEMLWIMLLCYCGWWMMMTFNRSSQFIKQNQVLNKHPQLMVLSCSSSGWWKNVLL